MIKTTAATATTTVAITTMSLFSALNATPLQHHMRRRILTECSNNAKHQQKKC